MGKAAALQSWFDVDASLLELGRVEIAKHKIEAERDGRVASISEHFKPQIQSLLAAEAHVRGEIEQFVREHQSEMDSRGFRGNYGRAIFRVNPKKSDAS